jgi:hypothetical protein
MPYEVKFENGASVNFDQMPTPQDINDVEQKYGWGKQDNQQQSQPTSGDGNFFQKLATPFAKFGVTAMKAGAGLYGAAQAGVQNLMGDKQGAQDTISAAQEGTAPTSVNVPGMGQVVPFGATNEGKMKNTEGQVRDIVGGGLGLASFASGNPALMGAMYNTGESIQNSDSLGKTALGAVEGAALGKVGELGFKGAGKLLGKAGKALETTGLGSQAVKDAASANYSRVLAPTTKANKIIVQKIAPEMADRRITAMTRGGILSQAEQKLAETGQQLTDAYAALPQDAKVAISPILGAIGKSKASLMMKDAAGDTFIPKANQARVAIWQNMQDELMKLSSEGNASVESIRSYRQLLDSGTYAKGLMTGSESVQKEVEAKGANILRNELAKQYPDIAVINKEFTFWNRVRNVTTAAIERKTGQAKTSIGGKVAATGGAIVGGSGGGFIGAIEGAKVFQWIHALATSPAWETVSGASKSKLADFLSKGETTKAGALLLLTAEKAGVGLEKAGEVIGGVPSVISNTKPGNIPGTNNINATDLAKKLPKPGMNIYEIPNALQEAIRSTEKNIEALKVKGLSESNPQFKALLKELGKLRNK